MPGTFPLIEVSGSSYEMGRQHGELAAEKVRLYLEWIEKLTGFPRERLIPNAMRLLPFIEDVSAKFVDEIRGLADGAKIPFEDAVLCQVRAEAVHGVDGACTAFALTGEATLDGGTILGQNQDLEPEFESVAILLGVKPDDGRPAALMFTFAGQLGYSGMNDRGVAHFANAIYVDQWRPGSPHYPVKRAVLERTSVDEVLELIENVIVCSAANMVVADGLGNIADLEILPDAVSAFVDDHPDKRIHANHCQSPEFEGLDKPLLADSYDRLARMRKLVADGWGSITVDTMKTILADHQGDPAGICRHGAKDMHSISGYIAQPEERTLQVRRGHGCDGTWTAYRV